MGRSDRQERRGREAIALATLYLVWGPTYLAIRVGLDGFPPFVLGALRFLIGGGAVLLVLRLRGRRGGIVVSGPPRRWWGPSSSWGATAW